MENKYTSEEYSQLQVDHKKKSDKSLQKAFEEEVSRHILWRT